MKKLFALTAFLALLPYGLSAQDWTSNPSQPSLLLFAEGVVGPSDLERSGVYHNEGTQWGTNLTTILELPAAASYNVLLKVAFGRRRDDVFGGPFSESAKYTINQLSLGFGVRFLWGRK